VRLPAGAVGVAEHLGAAPLALLVADRREALFAAALLAVSVPPHLVLGRTRAAYTGSFFTLLAHGAVPAACKASASHAPGASVV